MAPASTPTRLRATGLTVGHASPLGATLTATGVNFSVYSKYATGVELLLFDHGEAAEPSTGMPRPMASAKQRFSAASQGSMPPRPSKAMC